MGNNNLWEKFLEKSASLIPYLLFLSIVFFATRYGLGNLNNEPAVIIPTEEVIEPIENSKNHEITLTGPFIFQNDTFNINNYPSIKINEKIEGGFIEFDVDPYSWLVDRSSYLSSKSYFFAFRFFIGNTF